MINKVQLKSSQMKNKILMQFLKFKLTQIKKDQGSIILRKEKLKLKPLDL